MPEIARTPGTIAKARNAPELLVADPSRRAHTRLDVALLHAVTEAEERTEIDGRRKGRELEVELEGGTAHVRVLPRIDLELEERRAEGIARFDAQRLRRVARALERHEMIASAAGRQPRGVDE